MEPILSSDSPLHFLPIELDTRQLMIFDSLRFTLEMADYCFIQLEKQLEIASKGIETKIHFRAFNYAWAFIDHCQRFVRLYKALNPSNESIINELNYIAEYRNAIQHVDLNLEKNVNIIDNGRPIFGALKWVVNNIELNEVYTCLWISGIFNIDNIDFKQHNQVGYDSYINEIILETSTLKKITENEINLSETLLNVKRVVDDLNQKLFDHFNTENLIPTDWTSRKDLFLRFKNEKM